MRGLPVFIAVFAAALWAGPAFAGTVKGDFDRDGYIDLATGVWEEDLGFAEDAGVVIVLYGTADGLSPTDSQRWNQNVGGIRNEAEIGDQFGRSLAAGDFDGDGFSDLAVGVPGEDLRDDPACDDATFPCEDVGAVAVLYGSNTGLTARDQFWTQASPGIADKLGEFERFGGALAAANFGNGRRADLAIGVSSEGLNDAGAVHVLYGASGGLSAKGSQFWHQNKDGIVGKAQSLDHFGSSLAAADFGKSSHADLAVGVFNEDLGGAGGAGAVAVIYGGPDGLSAKGNQLWSQASPGIDEDPEFQDSFGWVLSAANFGKSGHADLAVGVPAEDLGAAENAGVVHVLYGTSGGLRAAGAQLWNQDVAGVDDDVEQNDRFGFDLTAANFGNGSYADLAVGIPAESVGAPSVIAAGAVEVLYGSATGLATTGAQFWHEGAGGLPDSPEPSDFFGFGLAAANYGNGRQADLAVGVGGEDVDLIANAGAVDVLYGTALGLSGADSQQWHENIPGIPDAAEEEDEFGESLAPRR
jgi:FG-GAP repeat